MPVLRITPFVTFDALFKENGVAACPRQMAPTPFSFKLYSFSLPPEGLRALNHAADAYVSAQLERSFRTLDYYKTILPQEETKYE